MLIKYTTMALAAENSHRHIYIADDDEDDRTFFLEAMLEVDPDVILKEAQDGAELMEILHTLSDPLPEVIFLDLNMPKKNGFDCLEEIRKLKGAIREVKVIMFSTSSDPQDIEKALELGASFYAVKPSGFDTLKSFLEQVLQIDWRCCTNDRGKFRLI